MVPSADPQWNGQGDSKMSRKTAKHRLTDVVLKESHKVEKWKRVMATSGEGWFSHSIQIDKTNFKGSNPWTTNYHSTSWWGSRLIVQEEGCSHMIKWRICKTGNEAWGMFKDVVFISPCLCLWDLARSVWRFVCLFVDFDVLYPSHCGLCCGYCLYTIYVVRTGMCINEIISWDKLEGWHTASSGTHRRLPWVEVSRRALTSVYERMEAMEAVRCSRSIRRSCLQTSQDCLQAWSVVTSKSVK